MPDITIEQIDRDGVLQETAAEALGDTRADVFRKAALGGGALLGSGALLGALPAMAGAQTKRDVSILNFALTLEFLEAEFYIQAADSPAIAADPGAKALADLIRDHEVAHVKFLQKALGRKAVKKPDFDFKGTTSDRDKFIATAIVLEDTGVRAYSGAGPLLSAKLVPAALSILTVEARHAAAVRQFAGQNPTPFAGFDKPASQKAVLSAVKKTGFITS